MMTKIGDKFFALFEHVFLQKLLLFIFYFILYAPIIVLIVFSFNKGRISGSWQGFSLHWYIELFEDKQIMKALYYTLLIAFLSSFIATIIGTFAAYGIYHYRSKPFRQAVLNINNIPVLNPDIVTAVGLMVWFAVFFRGYFGIVNGFFTLLVAHITFSIPYVVLSVLPKLKQMPKDTIEAALDLGATPLQAFYKVVFPEILSGVISGALIAFTLSIDDFVISFFTTGDGVQNLSIAIFSMLRKGISPKINALSALMFITVISLMLIIGKRTDIEEI